MIRRLLNAAGAILLFATSFVWAQAIPDSVASGRIARAVQEKIREKEKGWELAIAHGSFQEWRNKGQNLSIDIAQYVATQEARGTLVSAKYSSMLMGPETLKGIGNEAWI